MSSDDESSSNFPRLDVPGATARPGRSILGRARATRPISSTPAQAAPPLTSIPVPSFLQLVAQARVMDKNALPLLSRSLASEPEPMVGEADAAFEQISYFEALSTARKIESTVSPAPVLPIPGLSPAPPAPGGPAESPAVVVSELQSFGKTPSPKAATEPDGVVSARPASAMKGATAPGASRSSSSKPSPLSGIGKAFSGLFKKGAKTPAASNAPPAPSTSMPKPTSSISGVSSPSSAPMPSSPSPLSAPAPSPAMRTPMPLSPSYASKPMPPPSIPEMKENAPHSAPSPSLSTSAPASEQPSAPAEKAASATYNYSWSAMRQKPPPPPPSDSGEPPDDESSSLETSEPTPSSSAESEGIRIKPRSGTGREIESPPARPSSSGSAPMRAAPPSPERTASKPITPSFGDDMPVIAPIHTGPSSYLDEEKLTPAYELAKAERSKPTPSAPIELPAAPEESDESKPLPPPVRAPPTPEPEASSQAPPETLLQSPPPRPSSRLAARLANQQPMVPVFAASTARKKAAISADEEPAPAQEPDQTEATIESEEPSEVEAEETAPEPVVLPSSKKTKAGAKKKTTAGERTRPSKTSASKSRPSAPSAPAKTLIPIAGAKKTAVTSKKFAPPPQKSKASSKFAAAMPTPPLEPEHSSMPDIISEPKPSILERTAAKARAPSPEPGLENEPTEEKISPLPPARPSVSSPPPARPSIYAPPKSAKLSNPLAELQAAAAGLQQAAGGPKLPSSSSMPVSSKRIFPKKPEPRSPTPQRESETESSMPVEKEEEAPAPVAVSPRQMGRHLFPGARVGARATPEPVSEPPPSDPDLSDDDGTGSSPPPPPPPLSRPSAFAALASRMSGSKPPATPLSAPRPALTTAPVSPPTLASTSARAPLPPISAPKFSSPSPPNLPKPPAVQPAVSAPPTPTAPPMPPAPAEIAAAPASIPAPPPSPPPTAPAIAVPAEPGQAVSAPARSGIADEIYIAYARERVKWLYEIYKIGGMTLDEFRLKVQEKMNEDAGRAPAAAASASTASNPALANLNKELGKKFKK